MRYSFLHYGIGVRVLAICITMATAYNTSAQNVGIGTTNPTAPLSFQSVLGKKIVLHGDGNAAHTGIGVQSGFLQFYLGEASAKMFFGSRGLTGVPQMTVTGEAKLGINTTDPLDKLHISGPVRLRWGANPALGPGVWLGSAAPGASPYFIGMVSNADVGFYWSGANPGTKLYWNLTYGSMGVNGDVGANGFQLVSGGANAATTWKIPQYYSDFNTLSKEVFEPTSYNIVSNNVWQQMTGLSVTQTYNKFAKVAVHFNVAVASVACCGDIEFFVVIDANGVGEKVFKYYLLNGTATTVSGDLIVPLPPGAQKISIAVLKISGPDLQLSAAQGLQSSLILQVMQSF